jgi:Zn-dependent protease with chaperone function
MLPDSAETFAAVRQLLPWWLPWGRDGALLMTAAALPTFGAGIAVWFAMRPLHRHAPEHWAQRARLAYQGRMVARFCVLYFPMLFLAAALYGNPAFTALGTVPRALLAFVVALCGPFLVWRRTENRLREHPLSLTKGCLSIAAFLLLLMPHFLVALTALLIVPAELNRNAVLVLAGTALVCGLLLSGYQLRLASLIGLARRADARLQAIVDRAARDAGVSVSAVYVIPWQAVNAVAFPTSRCVAFTESALEQLTEPELEAVCHHELAHLCESRLALRARLLSLVTMALCLVAALPVLGTYGYPGLIGIAVAYLVIVRVVLRLTRRMEERADAQAHTAEPASGAYAAALEKICRLNLIPAVVPEKRPIHPHLYDRMLAAGVQPDFPRPDPPSRRRILAAILFIMLLMIAPVAADLFYTVLGPTIPTERTLQMGLLSPLNEHWRIAGLAYLRSRDEDWQGAAVFYGAATLLDGDSWHAPANLALVLVDRCAEAAAALAEAERRMTLTRTHRGSAASDEQFLQSVSDAVRRCENRPERGPGRGPRRRFRPMPEIALQSDPDTLFGRDFLSRSALVTCRGTRSSASRG